VNDSMTRWQKLAAWAAVQNWHKILLAIGAAITAETVYTTPTLLGKFKAAALAFLLYLVRPSQTSAKIEKISDAIPGNREEREEPPPTL